MPLPPRRSGARTYAFFARFIPYTLGDWFPPLMRIFPSRVRKSIHILVVTSGLIGLLPAFLLGLWQWRLMWIARHPSIGCDLLMDWSPYVECLNLALNFWVPLSLLVCGTCMFTGKPAQRRVPLPVVWGAHLLGAIGLVSLGLWVYAVPLDGAASGVWWMWWHK